MLQCERCGSRFDSRRAASHAICPRCRILDGVLAQLRFKVFDPHEKAREGRRNLGRVEARAIGAGVAEPRREFP